MATTVAQAFREFRANLAISDLQAATVSTRQQGIRTAITSELTVLEDFLVGSYRRGTMIAPLASADIDIFFALHSQYFQSGPTGVLDRTKRVLLKTYTRTPKISRNGQAVTITFNDFRVDVVPGFRRNGGGFLIPDSIGNRWIETDPRSHIDIWQSENSAHDGVLVPVMKMLKCWNRAHSSPLTSFHLETLALQTLRGVRIDSYPTGIRHVLDRARTFLFVTPDPAGYPGNVAGYLDSQIKQNDAMSRVETALVKALEAEKLESQGQVRAAIEKWGVIFGDYFPVYG